MSGDLRPKVVLADRSPGLSSSALSRLSGLSVVALEGSEPEELLVAHVKDAFAVITGLRRLPGDAIRTCPGLKLVAVPGAGFDHVDIAAATERRVYVANAPGANAVSVAELALGLMIGVARSFPQAYLAVRAGMWKDDSVRQAIVGVELCGKTAGIVGMGNVGRELARRLKALGMKVLSFTRRPSADRERETGAKFVPLDELLRWSDFVVLCCALTPETRGLIGRRELELMKPSAYLINVARGAIVDEGALVEALLRHTIAGAALDVLAVEPPRSDHPLFHLDNAIVVPHLGSRTNDAIERVSHAVVDEVLRVLSGLPPVNWVNRW